MSSRDMTINQIKAADKDFGAKHTISVKGFKDGGTKKPRNNQIPKWFKDFYDKDYKPFQQAFIESQSKPPKYFVEFAERQEQFNKQMLEFCKFVITQFKKHGWTK